MNHCLKSFALLLAVVLFGISTLPAQEIEPDSALSAQELPPLERLPVLNAFVEAKYPEDAMRQGLQGTVLLELVINEQGKVDSLNVVHGLSRSLDSAATQAVRQFQFTPAMAAGKPVAVAIQYEYRFTLAEVAQVPTQVNFRGTLRENGTRNPIAESIVALSFIDTAALQKLPIPFSLYLKKLGELDGQFVEDGKLLTMTDSAGHFAFKGLPAGKIVLSFPISGYEASTSEEAIESGTLVEMQYSLRRESYDEYELVVVGKMEKKEVGKQTLQMQEVRRIPGCGGDAIKVVRALPGVARPGLFDQNVVIRGASGDDSGYKLDGIRLPYLFHFGGLKSVYQSELLSSLDMMPGGFGARYGDMVGGVIEIKGRKAQTDRWHGSLDVNLLDASVLVEGPVNEKLALQVAGRYSYIGPVIEALTKDLPTSVVPYYWDGLVRADYKLSPKDKVFMTFQAAQDRLEVITNAAQGGSEETGDATNKALMDLGYQLGIVGYDHEFGSRLDNTLRMGLGRVLEKEDMFGYADVALNTVWLDVRDELRYKLNDHVLVGGGPDLEIMGVNYDLNIMSSTGIRGKPVKADFSRYGAYLFSEIRPVNSWLLIPSIRYDSYEMPKQSLPSYRMNTRWEYLPGKTLKAAAGTYNQTPQPWAQATDPEWGNPDLPLTTAIHYVVGHELDLTDLISLDVQGYYNQQKNIPRATDSINPVTGQAMNYLPDMEGRMYGMEVLLRHNLGKRFFGWIAYTLSRSERRAPTAYLAGYDFDKPWNPKKWNLFEQDQTHNLQVVASWKLPREWELGARFQYTTGNPETPHLGITENQYSYGSEFGQYMELKGAPLSERMDPNIRLDIRVDKRFVFEQWILGAYLDVQNATYPFYNTPEFYQYNYDYSQRQVVGGLLLPTLGVTATF